MFRVLTADPPWSFQDKLPGPSRGAEKNYKVMSTEDICNFSLPKMLPDSVLFLWRVSSQVEEAYHVVRDWGFEPHSEIVWKKLTVHNKRHFGMGRIVRAEHETCIIARRGRPITLSRSVRSVFEAQVGRHSKKPEIFYDIVEALFPGPYVELFARRYRPRWTCFGDELPPKETYEEYARRVGPIPISAMATAK